MERKFSSLTLGLVIVLIGSALWLYVSKSPLLYKKHPKVVMEVARKASKEMEDSLAKYAILNRKKTPQLNHSRSCGEFDRNKLTFSSQSSEDKAIFETFYLSRNGPTVCYGTFVEIGALDGITYSNSLFFERYLNWTGVLIEGNPELTEHLSMNRPNTRNFGGLCPCQEGQSEVLFVMNTNQAVGGVLDNMSSRHFQAYFRKESDIVKVPCKPMGAILREAGVKAVDIFFVDVEGSEHVVLKTMDWTIPVRIVMVEMGHSDAKDKLIRGYLEQQGFLNTLPEWDILSFCHSGGDCAPNEVFINPNYPQLPSKIS